MRLSPVPRPWELAKAQQHDAVGQLLPAQRQNHGQTQHARQQDHSQMLHTLSLTRPPITHLRDPAWLQAGSRWQSQPACKP